MSPWIFSENNKKTEDFHGKHIRQTVIYFKWPSVCQFGYFFPGSLLNSLIQIHTLRHLRCCKTQIVTHFLRVCVKGTKMPFPLVPRSSLRELLWDVSTQRVKRLVQKKSKNLQTNSYTKVRITYIQIITLAIKWTRPPLIPFLKRRLSEWPQK